MSVYWLAQTWANLPLRYELQRQGDQPVPLPFYELFPPQAEANTMVLASPVALIKQMKLNIALPLGLVWHPGSGGILGGISGPSDGFILDFSRRVQLLVEATNELMQKPAVGDAAQRLWEARAVLCSLKPSWVPNFKFISDNPSANLLARLIFNLLYPRADCEVVNFTDTPDLSSEQVIQIDIMASDDAATKGCNYRDTIDLTQIWHDIARTPFVEALWLKRVDAGGLPKSRLYKAAELAQAKMHVDPSSYLPDPIPQDRDGKFIDLPRYWRHCHYRMREVDHRGLYLLLHLACRLEKKSAATESLGVRMLRWEAGQADWSLQ